MVNLRSYIALGLILTGAAYSADFFSPFIGPTEFRGKLGFAYVEGENPITGITFQVDARIAGSLLILEVPAGWSHTFTGGTLELSGGSLSPEESLAVPVSLARYVEPGEYPVSSTGVTSDGETVQAEGSLVVTMMVILRTLGAISSVKTTASLGTVGLVFVDIILKRFRGRVDPGKPSEGRLSHDSVLTREQLDALAEELEKGAAKLPTGEGGIELSEGAGLTTAGHIITGDEKHFRPIPDTGGKAPVEPKKGGGFSDAAGLEAETSDSDYREGSESSHPRKMSGIPKHGNVELKRGILGDADVTPKVESDPVPRVEEEPEGEGVLERIANFFRNLF